MKLRYFIFIAGLLFMQACQEHHAGNDPNTGNQNKLNDAASYNTQLGLGYLNQGDRPLAKKKLFLALSQAPNSPRVHAAIGYFMEKSGDMQNAQIYYTKAMALAPGDGAQLNNYGAFLCRHGHYKQAEEYFLKAIQDIKYAHTAGAYENAGLCLMAMPDELAAANYFKKALEQDPLRGQSLYELVNIALKQGHAQEALTDLQKYPNLTLRSRALLTLAVETARKVGNSELEADYRLRLQSFSEKTGGKDEYTPNNG